MYTKKEGKSVKKPENEIKRLMSIVEAGRFDEINNPQNAEKKYREAQKIFEGIKGNLNQDEQDRVNTQIHYGLATVLRNSPEALESQVILASIAQKNKKLDHAEKSYMSAIRILDSNKKDKLSQADYDNWNVKIHYGLATIFGIQNRNNEAKESHRILAEIKERWGDKAKKAGQIGKAIEYYGHAIGSYKTMGNEAKVNELTLHNLVLAKDCFVFSDLTILDIKTKLMWTRDGNIAGKEMNWNEAFEFIEQLNKQKYAGYMDWRLPGIDELKTLMDFGRSMGYSQDFHELFNKMGFENVQSGGYWSSTTDANVTGGACCVDMHGGYVSGSYETFSHYVLPVRAGQ